jgi:hypothetical protein
VDDLMLFADAYDASRSIYRIGRIVDDRLDMIDFVSMPYWGVLSLPRWQFRGDEAEAELLRCLFDADRPGCPEMTPMPTATFTTTPTPYPTQTPSLTPTITITPTPTPTSPAEALRDIILTDGCETACLLGIERGVTTRDEARAILDDLGVQVTIDPYSPNPLTAFQWFLEFDGTEVSLPGGRLEGPGHIHFDGDIVQSIGFRMEFPIATVIEALGSPDVVHMGGFETIETRGYDLTYGSDRLIVFLLRTPGYVPVVTYRFVLADLSRPVEELGYPLPVDLDCPAYTALPCIVPTATPSP